MSDPYAHIERQIAEIDGFASDSMGMEPGDRQALKEAANTMRQLLEVVRTLGAVRNQSSWAGHDYGYPAALYHQINEALAKLEQQ